MKKYLVLCLVIALLLLVIPQATAFNPGTYLKHTRGLLVAYVNEKVEAKDPDKIRICFLSDAQDYQGISVEELFDTALPPMSPQVVLLAAMLNFNNVPVDLPLRRCMVKGAKQCPKMRTGT